MCVGDDLGVRRIGPISAASLPWEVGNAPTALFKRERIDLKQAQKALESCEAIPIHLPKWI